jgi:hypothetical protein
LAFPTPQILQTGSKWKGYSHECTDKRLPLSISRDDDAEAVGGPTEVVDAAGEGAELGLERAVAVATPDADASRGVGRGDPLAVGGETGDGGGVGVVLVGPGVEGRVEAAEDDAAAGAVGDRVRLGVPCQEDPAAALRRRRARVCLHQLRHFPSVLRVIWGRGVGEGRAEPGGRGGGCYITGVSNLRVRVNVHVAILI